MRSFDRKQNEGQRFRNMRERGTWLDQLLSVQLWLMVREFKPWVRLCADRAHYTQNNKTKQNVKWLLLSSFLTFKDSQFMIKLFFKIIFPLWKKQEWFYLAILFKLNHHKVCTSEIKVKKNKTSNWLQAGYLPKFLLTWCVCSKHRSATLFLVFYNYAMNYIGNSVNNPAAWQLKFFSREKLKSDKGEQL